MRDRRCPVVPSAQRDYVLVTEPKVRVHPITDLSGKVHLVNLK